MDAAIALVIAKGPGQRAPEGICSSPTLADLGFEAHHRLDWCDESGAVRLVVWHGQPTRADGAWHERDDGAVGFVAGSLRWRGDTWEPPDRWAPRLALAGSSDSMDDLQDAFQGVFAAGHLDQRGDGWLMTDHLGCRLLYWGESDHVVVVSTRAAVVADVLQPSSGAAPPDLESSCWLAFTGFRVGVRTAFEGVSVVRPGTRLRLRGGRPIWEHTTPLVLSPDDGLRSRSVGELAEIVQEDVADSLRAALSRHADRHVFRLSGGKDSRLLLAVAVRAGLAKEFHYETIGPPDLLDVQIATELCEHLGLRHEVKFLELANAEPFATRFRRFVASTACMVNGWDVAAYPESNDLTLTGLCGEALRCYRKVSPERSTDATVADAFPRSQFGRLGLLRGNLGDELHQQLLHKLRSEPSPSADPLDRVHALFAGARMRFTRMGAREELGGVHDLVPLYSPTTVRAAMALGSQDRQSELLFAEVMRRSSDLLVEHPFTDAGWDARAQAHLGERRPAPPATPAASAPAAPRPKAKSLIESLNRAGTGGRADLLREVVGDSANPAWDLLDRDVAVAALDRYGDLTTRERQELFGAATIAVWFGR